jgi:hypothetical protein
VLYRVYSITLYIAIGGLGGLQFLVPTGHIGGIAWARNAPGYLAIVSCLVLLLGQLVIASLGPQSSASEAELDPPRGRPRSYKILAAFAGLLLAILLSVVIVHQIIQGHGMPAIESVLLISTIYLTVTYYRSGRRL